MQKNFWWLIFVIAVVYIFSTVTSYLENAELQYKPEKTESKAKIYFWGPFDNTEVFQPLIAQWEKENPKIEVVYQKKLFKGYKELLQTEIYSGKWPDVFLRNNNWMKSKIDFIKPLEKVTVDFIREYFPKVVENDFVIDWKVYGVPLSVDTLALFYNKNFFVEKNLPNSWDKIVNLIPKYTVIDNEGTLKKWVIALGTLNSVHRSLDILITMMLQRGVVFYDLEGKFVFKEEKNQELAKNTILFFKTLNDKNSKNYTWDPTLGIHTQAFLKGKIGMIVGYSYLYNRLLEEKNNEVNKISIGIKSFPQEIFSDNNLTLANYWALAVNKNSENFVLAEKFVKFLTKKENLLEYHNLSGNPIARLDLIEVTQNKENIGVFSKQLLNAQSVIFTTADFDYFNNWVKNLLK